MVDFGQEIIKVRVNPHIGPPPEVILHKLFLDMVPSSSEGITRAMRGQLKPLCRNYLGRNGANVIVYVLISFHSRDVFCTLSCFLFLRVFVGFVLVWLFIIWPFIRFQGVKLRPRPHVSGYFRIRNFFFPDTATVPTYPANSTANPEKNKSALQSGKK